MKKLRRFLALVLCAALCFLLMTGCGSRNAIRFKMIAELNQEEFCIAFRKDDPLCDIFTAALKELSADGQISRLSAQYLGTDYSCMEALPGALLPIAAVLLGGISVGIMMLIPAVLKAKLGVSEMVNSLMLNYAVMYFIKYLLNTHLADKTKGQIMTYEFQPNAAIPQLVDNGSKLSWGFVVALVAVVLCSLFMYRTRWGYATRMIGINQQFSKYSGMNVAGIIILSQVLGGLLAGFGGGIEMLGRYTSFNWSALPGYGWTGITVAILAGNNPIYVPLAAFFISYLNKGCSLMSTYSGVPSQLIDILQAVIFLFFAAKQFLARYRQRLVVKSTEEELKLAAAAAAAEEGGAK